MIDRSEEKASANGTPVPLSSLGRPTVSRARDRLALATWRHGRDARVGCTVVLEWDRVSAVYPHIVPVAVVGVALSRALAMNPSANRRVALWGLRKHKSVRISFAVAANDHLRIAVVDNGDQLDARRFQRALRFAARDARKGVGPLQRLTRLLEYLPVAIGRPILSLWSLFCCGFGVPILGVAGAPFGAALLSSVERFGLPAGDVPFVPFTRCAMVCSIGAISPAVIARAGAPAVVDTVTVAVSFDHRVCDGAQIADLLDHFLAACYSPI